MGHFTNSDVTSGPTPAVHAGLNYKHATYTLSETASGSLTIAMCNLPAGARVVDATLGIDNANLYDTTTAATGLAVQVFTGGSLAATLCSTGSANDVVQTYDPDYASIGYRATSSSQVWIKIYNGPVGSGTATTIFSLAIAYDCQEDGD